MHELSIASQIVALAADHCRRSGADRVAAVTLRIGWLACVQADALHFSFELAREGTPLAGAILRIVDVPVRVWCPACAAERELPGIQRFACPACGTATGDIRAGRELDLESIELTQPETAPA